VKIAAIIAGLVTLFIGLLTQLSNNQTDQIGGKLIVVYSLILLGLLIFTTGLARQIAQWGLLGPVILFAGYLALRRFWL
jgi:hypothetical protein